MKKIKKAFDEYLSRGNSRADDSVTLAYDKLHLLKAFTEGYQLGRNADKKKYDILAMHMAEVKAFSDGNSTNSLNDIVEHCLQELNETGGLKENSQPEDSTSIFLDELNASEEATKWIYMMAKKIPGDNKRVSYLGEISSDRKIIMLSMDCHGDDRPVALAILTRNDLNKTVLKKINIS